MYSGGLEKLGFVYGVGAAPQAHPANNAERCVLLHRRTARRDVLRNAPAQFYQRAKFWTGCLTSSSASPPHARRTAMPASNPVAGLHDRRRGATGSSRRALRNGGARVAAVVTCLALVACATKPLVPYSDGYAAARARSRIPGGRAGQAGTLSRDLLRGARSTRPGASRLPSLRRRTDTRRYRARRHRRACRSGSIEASPHRGSGSRHRVRLLQAVAEFAGHRRETPAAIRIRRDHARRRRVVEFGEQCTSDPRRHYGHATAGRSAAARAGRLLKGCAGHPGGCRRVSGDP